MDALGLSLCMVVCDEGHRLAPMLAWHRPLVDEIVVVVQESDDATYAIACQYADVVIEHPRYGYCEASRREASEVATYDMQIILDADEQVTLPFARALPAMLRLMQDGAPGWRLKRRFWRDGVKEFEGDAHYRLIHRANVVFLDEIHTEPQSRSAWEEIGRAHV